MKLLKKKRAEIPEGPCTTVYCLDSRKLGSVGCSCMHSHSADILIESATYAIDYKASFKKAELTFRHQRVYDPRLHPSAYISSTSQMQPKQIILFLQIAAFAQRSYRWTEWNGLPYLVRCQKRLLLSWYLDFHFSAIA